MVFKFRGKAYLKKIDLIILKRLEDPYFIKYGNKVDCDNGLSVLLRFRTVE
jgi:hypothetical protein